MLVQPVRCNVSYINSGSWVTLAICDLCLGNVLPAGEAAVINIPACSVAPVIDLLLSPGSLNGCPICRDASYPSKAVALSVSDTFSISLNKWGGLRAILAHCDGNLHLYIFWILDIQTQHCHYPSFLFQGHRSDPVLLTHPLAYFLSVSRS